MSKYDNFYGIPSVKEHEDFTRWVRKVLPGVYDDSLSYYQLITKVTSYLNQMNNQQNQIIVWMEKQVEEQNKSIEEIRKDFDEWQKDLNEQWNKYKADLNEQWRKYKDEINAIVGGVVVDNAEYSIVTTCHNKYPIVTGLSGNISSVFKFTIGKGSLFLTSNSGGSALKTLSFENDTEITLPHNSVMIWDLDKNTYTIQDNNTIRPDKNILLAYHREGELMAGYFAQHKEIVEIERLNNKTLNEDITQVHFSGEQPIVAGNYIDLTKTRIHAIVSSGKEIKGYQGLATDIYKLEQNQVLIWDVDANSLKTQLINVDRPNKYVLLASCYNEEIRTGSVFNNYMFKKSNKQTHIVMVNHEKIVFNETTGFIDLKGVNFFAVSDKGTELKAYSSKNTESFTLKTNDVLIWDFDTNTFKVIGNNDERPKSGFVVMAYYRAGLFTDGWLTHLMAARSNKLTQELSRRHNYTHIVFSPWENVKVSGNVINMKGVNLFAANYVGTVSKQYNTKGNEEFTIAHNQILCWDWDKNELRIMGNNDPRPSQFVVMAYYSRGAIIQGELMPFILKNENTESEPISTESRRYHVQGVQAVQGLTIIGEDVAVFEDSKSDHSDYKNIILYKKGDFTLNKTVQHNMGHCASADYNANLDVLVLGNGEATSTVAGRIDLVHNIKETLKTKDKINFSDPEVISIEFKTDKKEIGGAGAIACFGEQNDIVYLMTGQSAPTKIFKLQLGMGTNDFSDQTSEKNDLTKWGTYKDGRTDKQFNGTARVIQSFTGSEYGTFQGLAFHGGKLHLGVTESFDTNATVRVIEIQCYKNGQYKATKTYEYPWYKPDGNRQLVEQEGVAIMDGKYVVAGYRGNFGSEETPDYKSGWFLYPIHDREGGTGKTGEQVTFKYPNNSVPSVRITPNSKVTDLYVDEVTTKGFTVKSSSDTEGTFIWESDLS